MSSVIDYLPLILKGMLLTIEVAVLSLLISVLLGMIGALAKMSGSRIARSIAGIYTTVIRGMPDLVLMTLIFFGGQILLNNVGEKLGLEYIDVSPFVAGGTTRKPFTFLCVVAFLYLLITGVSDIGIRWLDKRYSVGVRKA